MSKEIVVVAIVSLSMFAVLGVWIYVSLKFDLKIPSRASIALDELNYRLNKKKVDNGADLIIETEQIADLFEKHKKINEDPKNDLAVYLRDEDEEHSAWCYFYWGYKEAQENKR